MFRPASFYILPVALVPLDTGYGSVPFVLVEEL